MTVPFIRKSTQRNSSWPGDAALHTKAEYLCADLSIDPSLFPCSRAADHTFSGTTAAGAISGAKKRGWSPERDRFAQSADIAEKDCLGRGGRNREPSFLPSGDGLSQFTYFPRDTCRLDYGARDLFLFQSEGVDI